MKRIDIQCKSCGAIMEMDAEQSQLFCPTCGRKELLVDSDRVTIEKLRHEIEMAKLEKAEREQQNKNVHMMIPQKGIWIVIGILLVVLVIVILLFSQEDRKNKELQKLLDEMESNQKTVIEVTDEITVTAATLREVIAPAKELVSYKYYYTDAGVFEKAKNLFNTDINIPFTRDKTVYVYSGTISAGININEVDFDINEEKKEIIVKLPALKILYHEIDDDSFQAYDIKNSIFTETNLGEFEEFRKQLKNEQEEKLHDKEEFWNNAKENAEAAIKGLISVTDIAGSYDVKYEWVN